MIQTETMKNGTLIRHYSDVGMMIRQVETGTIYSDAIDVVPCKYTYEETDIKIETDSEISENDYLTYLNQLGVNTNG